MTQFTGGKESFKKYAKDKMKEKGMDPKKLGDYSDKDTKHVMRSIDKGWKADKKKQEEGSDRERLRSFVMENVEPVSDEDNVQS